MAQQDKKTLKILHVCSICLLISGFSGIVINLMTAPGSFPTTSLFLTGIGAMLAVAVSTKYLMTQQHLK
jgi:hypothetical protein